MATQAPRLVFFLLVILLPVCLCVFKFSNDTLPIWAPHQQYAKYTFLRPASLRTLSAPIAKMTVLVSAAPDIKNDGRTLALYRLYVNGFFISIGPGRGSGTVNTSAVYDLVDVPVEVLQAAQDAKSVSVALQCYHSDGGLAAWALLEAYVFDASGNILGQFKTGTADWYSYNADSIFTPGDPDTGSAYRRVNENIDARAFDNISSWRNPSFDPSHWTPAESRSFGADTGAPIQKNTQPLQVCITRQESSITRCKADRIHAIQTILAMAGDNGTPGHQRGAAF